MPNLKDKSIRKNSEAFFIAVFNLSLNEQVQSNVLHLFRNGITREQLLIDFNDFLAN